MAKVDFLFPELDRFLQAKSAVAACWLH